MEILFIVVAFITGFVVGICTLKWHYNRIWKRYPEQFILIAEGVIRLRESREEVEHE